METSSIYKKKVKVAIIDSGIDTTLSCLDKYVIKSFGCILDNNSNVLEVPDMRPRHEHGTAIAMIIRDICNEVEFLSINILDESLLSNGELLIYSFNKAVELGVDVIHFSLGTTSIRYLLRLIKVSSRAYRNNIIVVSAMNNSGGISYPAYLKNVLKVSGGSFTCKEEFQYRRGIFYAPYDIKVEDSKWLKRNDTEGNSFAAAYITGHVCKIMSMYPQLGIDEIEYSTKQIGMNKK